MSYIRADEILPKELLEAIQQYIDGQTIYERIRPGKIPKELFEALMENDEETAMSYGRGVGFLKRNNAELSTK